MNTASQSDFAPFEVIGETRPEPWLITCDHASNAVPHSVSGGDLGLDSHDMDRHIAYDIGAAAVTRHLSKLMDAPAVLSTFSRLVIDPNRGEDDPTILMKLYDGSIIAGNRDADEAELTRRLTLFHRPYHSEISRLANTRPAGAVYVAVHSFTPQLAGRPARPWHVGVLYAHDTRFSEPLCQLLEAEPDITLGRNEPYTGALRGDSVDRHALSMGRPNVLIELRHDLIATEAGQREWAERLAPILRKAREVAGL